MPRHPGIQGARKAPQEDCMKIWKRALPLGIASMMLAATPLAALAASPEFARSEEEWARLRDDKIEYDELAELIHEYNATVQKNNIDYNEFRKEYGDTNDEVAERYRELAAELQDNMEYPDIDDANYASVMGRIISNEQSIKDYNKQADNKVEDSYIKYMENLQAEANLVSSAQTEMITYYQNLLQLQIDQKNKEQLEWDYQSAVNKQNNGLATETAVLSAREALRMNEQALQNDQSAIDTGRQKLQVMLGWRHDDNPEIGEVPAVDENVIAAMDPAADKERALANNYTLLINKRKLENAQNQDTKETLQTTIHENETKIGASLTTSYQNVLAAKTAQELAVAQAALEQRNLETAGRQYAIGQIGQLDYETQRIKTETAQLGVSVAELKLFQAVQNYEWAVNGLAGA